MNSRCKTVFYYGRNPGVLPPEPAHAPTCVPDGAPRGSPDGNRLERLEDLIDWPSLSVRWPQAERCSRRDEAFNGFTLSINCMMCTAVESWLLGAEHLEI